MIKDRFGYRSPEIIFPNFFRNRSILSRSIAASIFNLEIRCSEWAFSNRTTSRSFSLCIFSTLYGIIEKSPVSCVSRKAPFSELLPLLHLAGRRAQHKYPYKPVEQYFHCHKIQNIRPSTIKKIGNIIPDYPCKPSSYDPHNQKIKSFI